MRIVRIKTSYQYTSVGDPNPDPSVRGINPDHDPSIIKQNSKENLGSCCFVTSFLLFIFEK